MEIASKEKRRTNPHRAYFFVACGGLWTRETKQSEADDGHRPPLQENYAAFSASSCTGIAASPRGSPTKYRVKRRITMFSPSSAILVATSSFTVWSGFLMNPCSVKQTVL